MRTQFLNQLCRKIGYEVHRNEYLDRLRFEAAATPEYLTRRSLLSKDRLLLCRPQGGLNDMLCQIEKCCQYADRVGRTVIVDTDYARSAPATFKDHLSKYFVSLRVGLVL